MKQYIAPNNIALKTAFMLVLAIFIHTEVGAQKHRRHARKHDQLHERIDRLEDNKSMTADQKKKIDKREKKLHRAERRSVRDGVITPEEQRHINRKYRKTNRAVKQVEKGK